MTLDFRETDRLIEVRVRLVLGLALRRLPLLVPLLLLDRIHMNGGSPPKIRRQSPIMAEFLSHVACSTVAQHSC